MGKWEKYKRRYKTEWQKENIFQGKLKYQLFLQKNFLNCSYFFSLRFEQ